MAFRFTEGFGEGCSTLVNWDRLPGIRGDDYIERIRNNYLRKGLILDEGDGGYQDQDDHQNSRAQPLKVGADLEGVDGG